MIADELPDLARRVGVGARAVAGRDSTASRRPSPPPRGEVIARLVCPRRLLPDSGWLACVVPAFEAACSPGGARRVPAGDELAGRLGSSRRERWPGPLPVYHHWRFRTGAGGDFETLCRRLAADDSGVAFGLQAMDVGDPGLMEPSAARVLLDYEGALRTPGVVPRAVESPPRGGVPGRP